MKYYITLKSREVVIFNNIQGTSEYFAKSNKPDAKRHLLHNLMYRLNLKKKVEPEEIKMSKAFSKAE